jgi:HAD superfamily hydrolase (TIGR01509 family)
MTDIELVIFDCDGVLVDSEPLSALAIQTVLRTGGIEVPIEAIWRCVGMKQADIVTSLEAETGMPIGTKLVEGLWPATRALFAERLTPTRGLLPLLEALPYRHCVASSSSHERIAFSLGVTGLARFFAEDAIFSSSDVAHGKPAPDLFLHAAARMGVAPARCVVIEDSRFGIMGAVAAGMTALGFVGGGHATPATAAALAAHGAAWVENSWPAIAGRLGMPG